MKMGANDDPLTLAITPPPDETAQQRLAREAAEAEAKRISDEIDEQIRKEKEQIRRAKKPLKCLLLGQSESGKTATLKNFQLTYARKEWSEERAAWRPVIFLNLIRNVNIIVSHLASEMADIAAEPNRNNSTEDLELVARSPPRALAHLPFTDHHREIRDHLQSFTALQEGLETRLGAATQELYATNVNTATPFEGFLNGHRTPQSRRLQEFSINSSNGWKTALDRLRAAKRSATAGDGELGTGFMPHRDPDPEDEVAEKLAQCRDYIKALWEDNIVREVLKRRKIQMEDAPGFFINDADRIASREYHPNDDDVIRARLRTLGVQEYRFVFDHGATMGQEWRIYDVGGTRSSRGAWAPYFDDVDAIIFLAPISVFDEKLNEDRRVNRLEDSYLLWRSVCANKLLSNTQIILFLNKCDLLQGKLQRGVRIRDSVPSFGERANDLQTATKYFQQHFKEIFRTNSPNERQFYVHLTSVIDTRSTAVTLSVVEERILREYLSKANLL